jgi:hypothetical protein
MKYQIHASKTARGTELYQICDSRGEVAHIFIQRFDPDTYLREFVVDYLPKETNVEIVNGSRFVSGRVVRGNPCPKTRMDSLEKAVGFAGGELANGR